MESLKLNVASCSSAFQFTPKPFSQFKNLSGLNFPRRKPRNHLVFASKDDPRLDEWDQMELKFGRMLGEDPKVTLAKIMGRKLNPDLSYLEIEKLLEKRKGKDLTEAIEEIPFDVSDQKKSTNSTEGLNLVCPVPNKGIKFEGRDKTLDTELNLVRPVPKKGTKFEESVKPARSTRSYSTEPIKKPIYEKKSSVPDVILRKPSSYYKSSDESSGLGMKPNISLRMGKDLQKERYSDITLLKKPETVPASPDDVVVNTVSENVDALQVESGYAESNDIVLTQKPELIKFDSSEEEQDPSIGYADSDPENVVDDDEAGISNSDDSPENTTDVRQTGSEDQGSSNEWQVRPSIDTPSSSMDAAVLIGKPKRLDLSSKVSDQKIGEQVSPKKVGNPLELEKVLTTSPIGEREEDDWDRAEKLVKTGQREEVELISSSTRGFVATFGSLIGFLPYRNLAARWKFLAFESWLRRKGLDPSTYRQNLGIIGKYDATNITDSSESTLDSKIDSNADGEVTPDMKLEDLLRIYDQEKLKFLSSFVGQRINVGVVLADRRSRKLIFSVKPKEKEELVERKRSVMARLSVGDVVKCCIKKITYIGIFVEVEGVPALIHQTEVSWDATLDPASYFKVGQIVDAKVHQLDFSLERIFLSLKDITPDPMMETLEAVVGGDNSLGGRLQAAEADTEWADVESLIKELESFEGIESVSKGSYFLSPGLAPTFQVYMASMFENQYKLLARAGNRVQEVIVRTSLGKEELKSAILTCTNRVE